jgi:hypothetical protein
VISNPGSERQRLLVFSYVWKTDPKETYTQKQTLSYTNLYVEHVCNRTTLLNSGGGKGKENDRASTRSKYITSVKVEILKAVKKMDGGGR